ncbi:hypothetical protein [Tenacibaculum maritimum]|uniref:hypothetical protein n=1 Tax=Tenacibaculum maritimum TaxID=107401 RepID=UPI0038763987
MKTIYVVLICLLVSFFTSCKSIEKTSEYIETETKKTTQIIQKDTVLIQEKDSSFYKAWIECKKNKPVLKTTETKKKPDGKTDSFPQKRKGRFLKPPNVKLRGNFLDVSCEAEAQKLFFSWKEKFIKEQTTKTKTIVLPPVKVPIELSWWQKLWIALGKFSAVVIIGWIGFKIKWRALFKLLKLV